MNRPIRPLLPAALVFCIGIGLTGFAAWGIKARIETEAVGHFAFVCDQITQAIHRRLEAVELVLRGGAAVFAASESVNRQEWKSYVDTLQALNELPGLQGVGFAERLPLDGIDRHRAAIRADGFPDYDFSPENDAKRFAPVIYIEPFAANRRLLGFDLFSAREAEEAMDKACDSDDAALSGQLKLPAVDIGNSPDKGALMFIPVYRKNARKNTADERREALVGWTFSPLRYDRLLGSMIEPWELQEAATLDVEVRDGLGTLSATPLFDSRTEHAAAADSLFYQSRVIDFNGRLWTLAFDRTAATGVNYAPAWLTLASGLGLSALLFALLLSMLSTRARALHIAEQLTRDIRQRESELRESEKKLFNRARQRRVADLPQGHRRTLSVRQQAGARTVRHDG
ncbi:MAG: CHASE domain-containing protein [Propionivibrio sp.]